MPLRIRVVRENRHVENFQGICDRSLLLLGPAKSYRWIPSTQLQCLLQHGAVPQSTHSDRTERSPSTVQSTQFAQSRGEHFVSQPEIDIATIVSRDFQENTFVARLRGRNDCVIIDPGLEPDQIEEFLDRQRLTPTAILNTHGHADHIGGNAALKRRWPDCPLVIGRGDAPMLTDAVRNLSAPFGFSVLSPRPDILVDDGARYSAAGFDFEVLAIPGHSVGHVVYLSKGGNPYFAFVGDVIFSGSIGRTDFPGGDFQTLISGIHNKLFALPDSTLLYPGHGPTTSVGREKLHNPFAAL